MIIRTGFAFKSCVGHLDEVVSRLVEIGSTTCAVADTFSTYAFVRLTKLAEAAGLRMVFGVEILCVPELGTKKQGLDRWTFLAKDDLRSIHELIRLACENPGSEPCLLYSQAVEAEGVFKIMGEATIVSEIEPRDDLFLGASPANPRGQVRAAVRGGHRLLARSANKYPRMEDLEFYRVALGRNASSQTYPMHILSDEEWAAATRSLDACEIVEAIQNRDRVLNECRARIKKADLLVPDKFFSLRQLCVEGARRVGCDLSRPEYFSRLDHELTMIREKGFQDYFYIVADIMTFARANMVVGPARGSSCSSLVCYLLGITAIDPIPFKLVFERFIDVTRKDLPDIDIDFSDVNRHLIFEYVSKKHGRHRSARLGSVNTFQSKAAMNVIGANLKIPSSRINELSNIIVKRHDGDLRAGSAIEDTFDETDVGKKFMKDYPEARIAHRLEEHPAAAAQHAAGIVLTNSPVIDYVAVNYRTGATMCDKKDAEDLNLLKIDALGLMQLSIFERCLELIGEEPRNAFLETIPLNDQLAFDVMNDRRFSGIFQFVPGAATTGLIERVLALGGRLDRIDDVVALTAIVRPGPLASGQADEWIKRRTGHAEVSYDHPSLELHLKDTMGLILFQEQILSIGREIGGLTWEEVTALRKAMSKSLGREYFSQFEDRWVSGAIERVGMPRAIATKVFSDLCSFGAYGFNLAHSVAYAVVSYWCMWLKAYHPLEFAAATLDSQKDAFLQIETLRELDREGTGYIPVDADESTDQWAITTRDDGRKLLLGPLTNVYGIGPRKLIEIMDARKNGVELKPNLRKMLLRASTPIDSLTPIADAFAARDLQALKVQSIPREIASLKNEESVCVFAVITSVKPIYENAPAIVAKRGYELHGPLNSVQFWARDDSGEMYCKIDRWDFDELGVPFIEQAKPKKSLYGIKGWVPRGFRMIKVESLKYMGEMDDKTFLEIARVRRTGAASTRSSARRFSDPGLAVCSKERGGGEMVDGGEGWKDGENAQGGLFVAIGLDGDRASSVR